MRRIAVALTALSIGLAPLATAGTSAQAASNTPIEGAGSTWSQIAVDQWRADVKTRQNLKVNFTGTGSSAGRSLYYQGKIDFAVSEIPFLADEVAILRAGQKSFQYLPIVAGGTALMYNVKDVAGRQVTNLQLSPNTIAGIFTGSITNWSDPKITADNGGKALPSKSLVPVVRSDGSGTSAQFTAFLAAKVPSIWGPFASANGRSTNTGTSDYPIFSNAVAQSGSDGVANYVANRSTGVGSIGYVETGYALQRGFPVAAVKNASGKYTLPTPANVSTALKAATLNADKTQVLTGVYNNGDATAYPISSYSYMITPTSGFNPEKGLTLSKFMLYFACDGQQKASVLGYAPLSPNLVQVVFDAIRNIPGHVTIPAKATKANCNNPTFSGSLGSGANSAGNSSGGGTTGNTTGGTGSGGTTTGGTTDGTTTGGTTTDGTTTGGTTDGTTTGGTTTSGDGTTQALTPVKVTLESKGASIAVPALILLAALIGIPLLMLASRAASPRLAGPAGRVKGVLFKADELDTDGDAENQESAGSHRKS